METYLVTGTNRGIGYEYCRQLQARGDRVIAVCRRASEELKQLGVRVEEGIDITSDASVADLRDRLDGTTIESGALATARSRLQNRDDDKSDGLDRR
jgi:NAD(P)-dependent dehydrogenase (short-subunit alcohol dehydrogenase family)